MKEKIKIKKKYIKTKDKKLMPIYYSKKKILKKKKIIIVIEEIFGVNKNIKNICNKIAKNNYIAIAPELFFRIKKINFNKKTSLLKEIINTIPDNKILSDINNVIKWSKKKYKTKKIGITGFCWGGRITWLYSYFYNTDIKTSVIWYGKLNNVKNNKHPIHPIDIVKKINIPILGLYAEKNKNISISVIKNMIKKINKNSKIIIYKNTKNRFIFNYKNSYNKNISKKSWKEMLNWFKKNIK